MPAYPNRGPFTRPALPTERDGSHKSFTNWFFDRKQVVERMGRAKAIALTRGGAIVMRDARKSIKSKQGASQPGTPPNAHDWYRVRKDTQYTKTGRLRKGKKVYRFKESVLFAFDQRTGGVVVGFYLFNDAKRKNPTVPQLHEHGGRQVITDRKGNKTVSAEYPARPTMRPALERMRDKLAPQFKGTFGG